MLSSFNICDSEGYLFLPAESSKDKNKRGYDYNRDTNSNP